MFCLDRSREKIMLKALVGLAMVCALMFCISSFSCIPEIKDKCDCDDTCAYVEGIIWAYENCSLYQYDSHGNKLTIGQMINDCNECVGRCAEYYMALDLYSCGDFSECLQMNCM